MRMREGRRMCFASAEGLSCFFRRLPIEASCSASIRPPLPSALFVALSLVEAADKLPPGGACGGGHMWKVLRCALGSSST